VAVRATLPDPMNQMCGLVLVTRFPIKIRICSCGNIGKSSSLSNADIIFLIIWDSFGSHTLAINKKKLKFPVAVSFSVGQ
jgi:hypothetical protein